MSTGMINQESKLAPEHAKGRECMRESVKA